MDSFAKLSAKTKIQSALLLMAVWGICLSLVLWTATNRWVGYHDQKAVAQDALTDQARTLSDTLSGAITVIDLVAQDAAIDLSESLARGSRNLQPWVLLQKKIAILPAVEDMVWVSANGEIRGLNDDLPAIAVNLIRQKVLPLHRDAWRDFSVVRSQSADTPTGSILISRSIWDETGNFLGLIVGVTNDRLLLGVQADDITTKQHHVLVTQLDHTILLSWPPLNPDDPATKITEAQAQEAIEAEAKSLSTVHTLVGDNLLTAAVKLEKFPYYIAVSARPANTSNFVSAVVLPLAAVIPPLLFFGGILSWLGLRTMRQWAAAEAATAENEQRLALALENTQQVLWDINLETRTVVVSDHPAGDASELGEQPLSEWQKVVHPDDQALVRDRFIAHLRGETPTFSVEHRLLRADGTWFWVLNKGKVVEFSPNGRARRVIGTKADISARKMAEFMLQESITRFRTLADNAPFKLWQTDANMNRNFFNRTWLEFRQRIMAEEIGVGWTTGIHPEDIKDTLDQIKQASDKRQPYMIEYRLLDGRGNYRWILEKGVPRYDEADNFLGYIGCGIDNTEQRVLQDKLQQSNSELEQFAYIASHDLQEPLRMVSSYLELLTRRLGPTLEEENKEFIDFAIDGARRMSVMIHDLLEYSRVKSRGADLVPTDLTDAANRAIRNLEAQTTEAGGTIEIKGPLPKVVGDAMQLERLFQNLINNALKYCAPGRPPVVTISADAHEAWATISITDNGIGIEPAYFDRIFQIFQRLHTRTEYAGTGIGLSVCKRIVERHGGRIWVESEPDKGATFRFTLPVAKVDLAKTNALNAEAELL